MSRNLCENLGLSRDSTSWLERLMNDYIEYALVEVDPGHLAAVEAVEMDPKDRHVLAAALSAGADILLTENAKHFTADAIRKVMAGAAHPGTPSSTDG